MDNYGKLARHIAALDGCWYPVRQQFYREFGRPDEKDKAGQKKFEEYLEQYIKGIKERLENKQSEFNF